ncbi:hypothetical protein LPJ70_000929, partial [Coemansia sp. RSA 2708]
MASYPYMARGSVVDSGYAWHGAPPMHAKQGGEAAAYDAQFRDPVRAMSAHGDAYSGPTMRSQYGTQPGPVGHAPYEQAPAAASVPSMHPGQPMGMHPPSYYPHEQVAVGGLNRSYLAPGSYVHNNKKAASLICPNCKQQVLTQVKTKPGARTVVAAAAIFAVYWPLAFIPFIAKPLKRKVHVCPRCSHKIGKV